MPKAAKVAPADANNLIYVRVRDQSGEDTMFKVKRNGTKMKKIFNTYAARRGLEVSSMRFLLRGNRIKPETSLADIDLNDEDHIDCRLADITICVNYQGEVTMFKIKRTTKMRKVFDAFATRVGLEITSLRFMLGGEIIPPESTPEYLDLEDNDLIDCRNEAITVCVNYKGEVTMFKIKRTTKMRKVFAAFAIRVGLEITSLRFLLDGEIITPESTPEDLELEDNDLIDCRNEVITICISYQGEVIMFRIRRRTKMAKLFTAFVARNGLNAANLTFLFGGDTIHPESTAEDNHLEDDSQVVCVDKTITIGIKYPGGKEVVMLRTSTTTEMGHVFDLYAIRVGMKSAPFRFLRDGELLSREDTAVDMGLEDGDQIDGFLAPACIHCPHCSNRI